MVKVQKYPVYRMRDPVHDLIQFNTKHQIDDVVWKLLQSRPFQRLRRVKQLGFSEFVYPGATHTRFAHSIGVFHMARELMKIVKEKVDEDDMRERVALAAALVHDVGHGPFSHAFESVGDALNLKLANHEKMSDELIRNSEITEILDKGFMSGFASNVAKMILNDGDVTLHNSVVSSQFDADRLDYMRRDRMMTGSQHSAIDLTWLFANLEVDTIEVGVDEAVVGHVPTFVIGSKSIQAIEAYVLGLFQLYPTIYYHKATRGAEKIFAEILIRIVNLVNSNSMEKTGLPPNHPLIKFAQDPESVTAALNLDDTVVWGALHLLTDSGDKLLADFSDRLLSRRLFKCIDIRNTVSHHVNPNNQLSEDDKVKIEKYCDSIQKKILEWQSEHEDSIPRLIVDSAKRTPYKPGGGDDGPLAQITVRTEGNKLIDVAQRSEIVKSLSVYRLNRVYFDDCDSEAKQAVKKIIEGEIH